MKLSNKYTLREVIESWPRGNWSNPAMVFMESDGTEITYSYGQLYEDVTCNALAMAGMKIDAGDLVVLSFNHSYDLVAAFLGAIYRGAIPTIFPYLNRRSTLETYAGLLNSSFSKAGPIKVLTLQKFRSDLSKQMADDNIAVYSLPESRRGGNDTPIIDFPEPNDRDIAFLQHSSGTTDIPKGIPVTHRMVINHIKAVRRALPYHSSDVTIGWVPFSHELGLIMQIFLPLMTDTYSVNLSPFHWMGRPCDLFRAIHKYGCTACFMPNFGFNHSARNIRDRDMEGVDLSGLRLMGSGGEPVRDISLRHFTKRFEPYGFKKESLRAAYGMAENAGAISLTPAGNKPDVDWVLTEALQNRQLSIQGTTGDESVTAIVSCGYPIEGTQITIVDEEGHHLPERHVGEVLVRGNSLFQSYWHDPQPNASTSRNGWFHTGDIGYMANRQLYICDRKQDVIISGGRNIFPETIEFIAESVMGEKLKRSVAFGVYDKTLETELPILACELLNNLTEKDLQVAARHLREQVHQTLGFSLADVRFVKRGWVVRSTSGKLDRRANREKYIGSEFTPRVFSTSNHSELTLEAETLEELKDQLKKNIEEALKVNPIEYGDNFFQLGVDSLLFMKLFTDVEDAAGIELPLEEIFKLPTVDHLAEVIWNLKIQNCCPSPAPADTKLPSHPPGQTFSGQKATPASIAVQKLLNSRYAHILFPYYVRAKLITRVCRAEWVKKRYFGRQIRKLNTFVDTIGLQVEKNRFIQDSLTANTMRILRMTALNYCSRRTFDKYVSVEGFEIFLNSIHKGRGIVLVQSHFTLQLISTLVLHREGFTPIYAVGKGTYLKNAGMERFFHNPFEYDIFSPSVWTLQLFQAKKALENGQIASVFADGAQGVSGIALPFHGRIRKFRAGFADLAIRTNADAIPVFVTTKSSGHMSVHFMAPLDRGSVSLSHEHRCAHLIRQYARLLEQQWIKAPHNILWNKINQYMNYPSYPARNSRVRQTH